MSSSGRAKGNQSPKAMAAGWIASIDGEAAAKGSELPRPLQRPEKEAAAAGAPSPLGAVNAPSTPGGYSEDFLEESRTDAQSTSARSRTDGGAHSPALS